LIFFLHLGYSDAYRHQMLQNTTQDIIKSLLNVNVIVAVRIYIA